MTIEGKSRALAKCWRSWRHDRGEALEGGTRSLGGALSPTATQALAALAFLA